MFENEQKISKIVMKGRSHNFCPLGNAHYTNHFTIEMEPNKCIPDYLEVERFIKENINDKKLIIEDSVAILADYIYDKFAPKFVIVSSHVTDAAHPEVEVFTERY